MIFHKSLLYRAFGFALIYLVVFSGCDDSVNDPVPEVPTLVYPVNGSRNEPNATELQWNTSTSALSYHIQVSDKADFSSMLVDEDEIRSNSYALIGLEIGKTYFWRVRALNEFGAGDWTEEWDFRTNREGVIPPIPALSTPPDGEQSMPTQIEFEWLPVEGATAYHIQVSLEENFIRRSADVEGIRETSTIIRGLVPTYTYFWRVRAQNPLGYSNWTTTRFLVIGEDELYEYGN